MKSKIKLIPEFSARTYQESIFASSIDKNSLVVLPTGLGKTIIALMLCVYYYNKTGKKVLFLAPTKPLVVQQEKSFKDFFENSSEFNFSVLTGLVSPKKRVEIYSDSDFVFSTPQLVENDIINGIFNPKDFGLVIFDEAHRATGNYAYCFIAEEFGKLGVKFLALTASPGTSKDEINDVIAVLRIENLQVKTYDDYDVKPYVNKTKIDNVKVKLPTEFEVVRKHLNEVFLKRLNFLKEINMLQGKSISNVTRTDILKLSAELRHFISDGQADENIWKAVSIAAAIMKLQHGIELFESQEVSAAHTFFHNILRPGGDSSKAAEELAIDVDFRAAFDLISKFKKENLLHPKLVKLKELIVSEINRNSDLKIIVFSQYRDSALKIVSELSEFKGVSPSVFVGQAKKGDLKMSQKDQKKVLDDFREGNFNVLVSTSVGEEGLDIPKVDLVIFYEPVPSAIRSIQRVGRTGRFNEGKAYILQTEGTRDIVTSHIANAKERKMYKVLNEISDEFYTKEKSENSGLNKFIRGSGDVVESRESRVESVEIDGVDDSRVTRDLSTRSGHFEQDSKWVEIYVDQRENTSLIKELFKLGSLKVVGKQLDVGDIIISEKIGIERKEKLDFVNSIIDKRLFPQLIDLAKNFRRPILIIEGSQNIFTLRNVNPNVIRSTLSAISVDLRIPIIFTDSIFETAQMVETIAKRTVREKKEISLVTDKRAFSENEELEKFVSSIPSVNVVTAKNLLTYFKSLNDLVGASEKELLKCAGIGKLRAKGLVEFFDREYK